MALTDLHVNGPATIQIDLTGNQTSFQNFGFTEDGVDVEIQGGFEDVNTDDAGPFVPGDVQFMGEVGIITLNMIRWDDNLMFQVLGRVGSLAAGLALATDVGTLIKTGLHFLNLRILANARTNLVLERKHTFPQVYLEGSHSFRVGTRVTRRALRFRALPTAGVLYTSVF